MTRYVRYYALYTALGTHAAEHDLGGAACPRLLRRSEPDPARHGKSGERRRPGALPARLATATLAARIADLDSALAVLSEPVRFIGE
ncbi:hypothetical protein [Actinomadura chibensis]|uniref:Uncharacterized protein n=1 Tax=Actinomadura chibensis TaxID=392828 RepID=A0A5D0NE78_9ACTN|nr:hypothetical protein [Actinomadura chibensis]TYB42515.1 hypothetical protein FXF69_32495 [Actinomadura chibensis]